MESKQKRLDLKPHKPLVTRVTRPLIRAEKKKEEEEYIDEIEEPEDRRGQKDRKGQKEREKREGREGREGREEQEEREERRERKEREERERQKERERRRKQDEEGKEKEDEEEEDEEEKGGREADYDESSIILPPKEKKKEQHDFERRGFGGAGNESKKQRNPYEFERVEKKPNPKTPASDKKKDTLVSSSPPRPPPKKILAVSDIEEEEREGEDVVKVRPTEAAASKSETKVAPKDALEMEVLTLDFGGARANVEVCGKKWDLPSGVDVSSIVVVDAQGQFVEWSVGMENMERQAEVHFQDKVWTGMLVEMTQESCLLEIVHPAAEKSSSGRKEFVRIVNYKYIKWSEPRDRPSHIYIHHADPPKPKAQDKKLPLSSCGSSALTSTILFITHKLFWQPRVDVVVFAPQPDNPGRDKYKSALLRLTLSAAIHNRGRLPVHAHYVDYKVGYIFGGSPQSSKRKSVHSTGSPTKERSADRLLPSRTEAAKKWPKILADLPTPDTVIDTAEGKGRGLVEETVYEGRNQLIPAKSITMVRLQQIAVRGQRVYMTQIGRNIVQEAYEVQLPFTLPASVVSVTNEGGSLLGKSQVPFTSKKEPTWIRTGRVAWIRAEHVRESRREHSAEENTARAKARPPSSGSFSSSSLHFTTTLSVSALPADERTVLVLVELPGGCAPPLEPLPVQVRILGESTGVRRYEVQVRMTNGSCFYEIMLKEHQRAVCEWRILKHKDF